MPISRLAKAAGATLLCLLGTGAYAQAYSWKLQCQSVGGGAQEALGDREGHTVSVGNYNCRTEGGPVDGPVLTGYAVWEWDKGNAVNVGGFGVYRKPGAMLVYQHIEGKMALIMDNGKVTGRKATGGVNYTMATGSAAVLKGKKVSYASSSTGPGLFVVELKAE